MPKVKPICLISLFLAIAYLQHGCRKDSGVPLEKSAIQDVKFWAYQIDDLYSSSSIKALLNSHYDLIVIDQVRSLAGDEEYNTKQDVNRIKNSPNSQGKQKLVISYLDAGQAEKYRYYWQSSWETSPPEWLLEPDPDGWNDNFSIMFWHPEWKSIIKNYLSEILDDGFDGVYLDWLMIYELPSVMEAAKSQGLNSKDELFVFIDELKSMALSRNPEFIFICQNAPELGQENRFADLFDAIAQEHIWFDGAGDPDDGGDEGDHAVDPQETEYVLEQLNTWKQKGKVIFNVEYALSAENADKSYFKGVQHGLLTYVTSRRLNKLSGTPPPSY
jgi:cysteinyl-tRNA synthetase